MSANQPIGIFDSGIGGLTVLKKLQDALPHEHFIYYADTAHLPYGEKTPAQIIDYTRRIGMWMQNDMGAKLLIAACNTSSSLSLNVITQELAIPVIGTIHPIVDAVLENSKNARVGILATFASTQSRMHEDVLRKAGFQGIVQAISCPRFVPLIESGYVLGPEITEAAQDYLQPFLMEKLNTLIYGCTHYPLIAQVIQPLLPSSTTFIDPADAIVVKTAQELYRQKTINPSQEKGFVKFYCSALPEKLSSQISQLMKIHAPLVHLKELEASHGLPSQRVANA